MFKKTLARCPYCGYVWVLRIAGNVPTECPANKERFTDMHACLHGFPNYATQPVSFWTESFDSSEAVRVRLEELKKVSKKFESSEDFEDWLKKDKITMRF